MEFTLNDYHRSLSNEELLQDLFRVATLLGKSSITRGEYKEHGKYSWSTISKRFHGWNKALVLAGLKSSKKYSIRTSNIGVTDGVLLKDMVLQAQRLGKDTITSSEYEALGQHGASIIKSRFSSWEKALSLAGLQPTGFHHTISDEELLREIERVWIALGRQPTTTDIRGGISKYSLASYSSKFGGWRKALEAFIEWINSDRPDGKTTISHDNKSHTVDTDDISIIQLKDIQETLHNNEKHQTTRTVGDRLRFKVLLRDNFKCCACGASPAKNPSIVLHIDHIIPWSKGGETTLDNLQTLCSKCNLGKSDLTI